MKLTMDALTDLSANANLLPRGSSKPAITVPLVQGMGFVTAIYTGVTPYIDSSVFIEVVTPYKSPKEGVSKYRLLLKNGKTWLLYAVANNGTGLALNLTSPGRLEAPGSFSGIIQIARNPGNTVENEKKYETCAGAYATGASVSGSVNGKDGSYSLTFKKAGNGSPLMMFALPHHVEAMDATTAAGKTGIQVRTTTKGLAAGIIGDSWRLVEPDLPSDIGFAPWSPVTGSTQSIPAAAKRVINGAAVSELSQDMEAQSNLDSMYFSGKALSKFATVVYAVHDLAGNVSLAEPGLAKLKKAFSRFTANTQKFPLTYESAWGGVVSTATYATGDVGADFGNSYYNDHQ
jgi:endo-1,3(4)-beta-glucanase